MNNLFTRILKKIEVEYMRILPYFYKISLARKHYWNLRASQIHISWGDENYDFEVVESVLHETSALTILDIGAGSGRMLELYAKIGGLKITAQDISSRALELMKNRNLQYNQNIKYRACEINDITEHFDLVLSNRVLAAIPPQKISEVVGHFKQIARNVYINEPIKTDGFSDGKYWFIHDYDEIFQAQGFSMVRTGKIGQITYSLWKNNKQ